MASQTGSNTIIAFKVAGTFGTAVACGTGDKMEVESLTQSTNPTELTASPIGSGQEMANDSQVGAESPGGTIEGIEHFNDAKKVAEAVFFQGASIVAWAGGLYSHSLTHSETWNQKFGTLAWQDIVGSVMENASCAITGFRANYGSVPDYGRVSFDYLANARTTTGTTNTFSSLETCTLADTERVVVEAADTFQINLQTDGALSTTHNLAVTSIVCDYQKPQEHSREIRGSAGNGVPVPSGNPPFSATLTVTLKDMPESTWLAGYAAGTEWKATITITGTGSRRIKRHFPRLKLVQDIGYGLQSAGQNPLTLTFKCLAIPASGSIPSGMFAREPHVEVVNTRSTSFLA